MAGNIKCDLILSNVVPADYVFEPNYHLRSLSEVESFVKKNKHLPGIQSEQEIKKNGGQVVLGEMQMKLLEKVEELTLYTIAQEKGINVLKQENKGLKADIQELKFLVKKLTIKKGVN